MFKRAVSFLTSRFVLATFFLASFALPAQARLFEADDVIEMTISAPFNKIQKERDEDEREYRDGTMTYLAGSGEEVILPVKLEVRGRFRAKKTTCRFPPLRLKVNKDAAVGTEFEGQGKLKLVTHCKSSARFEDMALQEYLIYRTLNILTDRSFRVRLFKVTYFDSDRGKEVDQKYAFVIEDIDDVADRQGLEKFKENRVEKTVLDRPHHALVGLFEYFIANTDFSFVGASKGEKCCHNGKMLFDPARASENHFSIIYDFDFSGVINAPYAAPSPDLKIKSVRKRIYRGFCLGNEAMPEVVSDFQSSQEEIYDLWRNQEGLSARALKSSLSFFDKFYKTINKPSTFDRQILSKCR